MKKNIYITLLLLSITSFGFAQQNSIKENILNSIKQNNTQLKALKEMSTADKIENRTTNNLENPEVEVTHKPKASGNYANTGVEVTQGFDFPTAYKHRSQVINLQNERIDLEHSILWSAIRKEALSFMLAYSHQAKLLELIKEQVQYAQELHKGYEILFEKGDINILERNKTKLNLLEVEKDLRICEADLNAAKLELKRLNGGISFETLPTEYTDYQLPLDFDQWYQKIKLKNPRITASEKNIEMSRKQEQLARSLNLPKLKAGYVGDLERSNSRHGFLVSVTVPLWGGRNTVKSKKAQTIAMQYQKEDTEHEFRKELYVSFDRAQKLSTLLKEYSDIVDNSNNFILLKKAFDMGQLSLIEYLQELLIYHNAVNTYLETEKEYFMALSNLEQWEK